MKHVISAFALSFVAGVASAQSWSHEADRAVAPRAIAGDASPGFEIVCYQGEWFMYLFGLPTAEGASATISVDDKSFPVTIVYGNGSDGIELNGAILTALKAGNSVRVSSNAPSSSFGSTYGLRGSSRALNAVEAQCAYPSPATAPDRFLSPPMGSTSEATTIASSLLRPVLEEAHEIDPKVGIEGANLVNLENGWSFLIADIGPSTMLYGMDAVSTVIAARPPSGDWRIVAEQTGVSVFIDDKNMTNGFPDIWYQAIRGVNQPYALWQWDGANYDFSRTVPN